MIRILILVLFYALPLRAEEIVAGLSQNRVSITANFDGSEILIYGAVKRESPVPEGPPIQVIVTVEGPPISLTVRRKDRRYGVWMNNAAVRIDRAPSFYAIATTGPLAQILNDTEDLRQRVSIPRAIRAIGTSAEAEGAEKFIDAFLRLQQAEGRFVLAEDTVELTDQTLFRTDVVLPADLSEGDYRVRILLTRGGKVVDAMERDIAVRKEGLERFFFRLAHDQPLIYGLVSLLLAVVAGWGASAAFRLIRV